MFNAVGNLAVDPRAGLLFVGFKDGATLQLTGDAEVLWEQDDFVRLPVRSVQCVSGSRRPWNLPKARSSGGG
jgi:hypothetical protein